GTAPGTSPAPHPLWGQRRTAAPTSAASRHLDHTDRAAFHVAGQAQLPQCRWPELHPTSRRSDDWFSWPWPSLKTCLADRCIIIDRRNRLWREQIASDNCQTVQNACLSVNILPRQPALGVQRRLTTHAGCGNCLFIDRIRHITGSEHALDACRRE